MAVRANRNEIFLWIYFVRSILRGDCFKVVHMNKVLGYLAVDFREVKAAYCACCPMKNNASLSCLPIALVCVDRKLHFPTFDKNLFGWGFTWIGNGANRNSKTEGVLPVAVPQIRNRSTAVLSDRPVA